MSPLLPDFMLVAESNLPATELPNLGTFQLMPGDAMSKFRYGNMCHIMITHPQMITVFILLIIIIFPTTTYQQFTEMYRI